jgi:hypothetical protein
VSIVERSHPDCQKNPLRRSWRGSLSDRILTAKKPVAPPLARIVERSHPDSGVCRNFPDKRSRIARVSGSTCHKGGSGGNHIRTVVCDQIERQGERISDPPELYNACQGSSPPVRTAGLISPVRTVTPLSTPPRHLQAKTDASVTIRLLIPSPVQPVSRIGAETDALRAVCPQLLRTEPPFWVRDFSCHQTNYTLG